MLLSLLGGTFVPAENYPPLLRSVAFAMPNGAAQQGFVDVLAHAHTFTHVAGRVATTWAWAIVLTGTSLFLGLRRSDA
jgi:hypothetical protein